MPFSVSKLTFFKWLPEFPTTTIGSFPQTAEVRSMRAKWKKGELTTAEYEAHPFSARAEGGGNGKPHAQSRSRHPAPTTLGKP